MRNNVTNVAKEIAGKCKGKDDCKNGGYMNPGDCKSCLCPSGFGGPKCERNEKSLGELCCYTQFMFITSKSVIKIFSLQLKVQKNKTLFKAVSVDDPSTQM